MPASSNWRQTVSSLVPLGAACLFVLILATFHPGLHAFRLNKDEGFNWTKARLVADGYPLYTEIWSDQPPGFTWLLAGWGWLVGWGLPEARLFMLIWTGLLIFSLGDILRRECGLLSAALGVIALVCSQGFLTLSVALMIGLPAIASAMLSLWALSRWSDSRRLRWVALAGASLGVSVTIKMFTGFLIPIVLLWLIINGRAAHVRRYTPAVAWFVALMVVLAGAVFTTAGDLTVIHSQLLGTHVDAHGTMIRAGTVIVPRFFEKDLALFVLAAFGLVTAWGKNLRRPSVLRLFGAWFAAGSLFLVCHRPVWSHHALLLTVPAAVLAGAAWRIGEERWRRRLVFVALLAIIMGVTVLGENRLRPERYAHTAQWAILGEMARFREVTRSVVAGTQLFNAHLDLRTPPELAVTSRKRFKTGRLDAHTISQVIKRERPEQVLLTRDFPKKVREHLRHEIFEDYLRTAWKPKDELELFLRRDLLPGGTDPPVTASNFMLESDEWFTSEIGIRCIDRLVSWQNPHGGWAKGYDAARPHGEGLPFGVWHGVATFDNDLTCTEIRVLGRAFGITKRPKSRQAIESALDFVTGAAYPNGGWPQCSPPPEDYRKTITFNDDAMVNVLKLLQDVVAAEEFAFVDSDRRQQARTAFELGLDCLLRCQIQVEGFPTGWAQHYDPESLAPVKGRKYEPPAIAGKETAHIVLFLMGIDAPSPAVREAIHSAAAWLNASRITGHRLQVTPEDVTVVEDPNAPPLWARLYDISTNRPIYCGHDGVIRYALADIERERRHGYQWLGPWTTKVLVEYPWWVERQRARESK